MNLGSTICKLCDWINHLASESSADSCAEMEVMILLARGHYDVKFLTHDGGSTRAVSSCYFSLGV